MMEVVTVSETSNLYVVPLQLIAHKGSVAFSPSRDTRILYASVIDLDLFSATSLSAPVRLCFTVTWL
jgi:hypothetical protein